MKHFACTLAVIAVIILVMHIYLHGSKAVMLTGDMVWCPSEWEHCALFSWSWSEGPQRSSPSSCSTAGDLVRCHGPRETRLLYFHVYSDPCEYLTRVNRSTFRVVEWNTWPLHTSSIVCMVRPLKGAKLNTIPDSFHELNLACCLVLLSK